MFTYFDKLLYVDGSGEDNLESVEYVLKHDAGSGSVHADSLMIAPWRFVFTAARPPELTDGHIDEIIRFIRRNRDAIKYGRKQKSYHEWCTLGIPLEDYLPLFTAVGDEWMQFGWLEEPGWNNEYGQETRQWANAYLQSSDRPKPEHTLYHTFYNMDGVWTYCGLCRQGNTANEVPELQFYGKLEFPGDGGLGGAPLYYSSHREWENDLRHWSEYNRPVTPSYLTRQEYIQELNKGKGLEVDRQPCGPLSAAEIAKEAEKITSRLHGCRNRDDCNTILPGHYEVQVSNRFMERAQLGCIESAVMMLVQEFHHQSVRYRIVANGGFDSKSCFLYFPYEEKEAREGVGLGECQKRYRDANGVLTCPLDDVAELTRSEADAYYRHGEEYVIKGMLYTFYRPTGATSEQPEMCLFSNGIDNIFTSAGNLGTFLPDVSSRGEECVAVKDKRYQPIASLTKSLRAYVRQQLKEV